MHFIKRYKYQVTIILMIIIVISIIIVKRSLIKNKYDLIIENETIDLEENTLLKKEDIHDIEMCTVDIKGAISKPGVYTSECNKYIHDIIDLAGGLTNEADTSVINLAKKITDEMVIVIYTKDEISSSNAPESVTKIIDSECICPTIKNNACTSEDSSSNEILININKASTEELKSLPGIGDAKAKAIVDYRNNNGPFKNIEDIKKVSGIGTKLYEEIKTFITT